MCGILHPMCRIASTPSIQPTKAHANDPQASRPRAPDPPTAHRPNAVTPTGLTTNPTQLLFPQPARRNPIGTWRRRRAARAGSGGQPREQAGARPKSDARVAGAQSACADPKDPRAALVWPGRAGQERGARPLDRWPDC